MGLPRDNFRVGPEAVMGIEINTYAAELARLTVWITELQWQLHKGLGLKRRPILDRLDGIARADALITQSGKDSAWPEADVVVGNPPFLGGKRMRKSLGDDYVDRLFAALPAACLRKPILLPIGSPRPGSACARVGLSARAWSGPTRCAAGANRRVLDTIVKDGRIFDAWDDEPWVIKGVAVRVSLICFSADAEEQQPQLDGKLVERIGSDLTASKSDLTDGETADGEPRAAFMGDTKGGGFDVPGDWRGNGCNYR